MIGSYKGKPDEKFIGQRDTRAPKYKLGFFGADCEFPEYHQSLIDPNQSLYTGAAWDTTHVKLKNQDYKLITKEGKVHVGDWPKKQIRLGNIHHLVIWKWDAPYKQLYLNQEVGYTILGIVDAKTILKVLEETNSNYFDFNQIEKVKYV